MEKWDIPLLAQIFHLSLPKIWRPHANINYFFEKYMKRQIIPKSFKALAVILKLWQALDFWSFSVIFSKIWQKHYYVNQLLWKPEKTFINSTGFLPLIDSSNGLPTLKFVQSTVFEIMGRGLAPPSPPPFVEGVGTKYLRTGRVKSKQWHPAALTK